MNVLNSLPDDNNSIWKKIQPTTNKLCRMFVCVFFHKVPPYSVSFTNTSREKNISLKYIGKYLTKLNSVHCNCYPFLSSINTNSPPHNTTPKKITIAMVKKTIGLGTFPIWFTGQKVVSFTMHSKKTECQHIATSLSCHCHNIIFSKKQMD
jgi:hypothetical protein